jgi:hypothetical protein
MVAAGVGFSPSFTAPRPSPARQPTDDTVKGSSLPVLDVLAKLFSLVIVARNGSKE